MPVLGGASASRIVLAMLRVSATACSTRSRIGSKSAVARIRSGAARRGLKRPLSRAWRTTLQACSMSWSSSPVRSIQPSMSSGSQRRAARGHVAQQRADAVVDSADLVRGGAVAQRRPHEQVHEQADRDADARVEQPRDEHAAVVAVAGGQHDERGGGRRRRLGAQPAHAPEAGPRAGRAERERVEAEGAAGGEGEQHAEHARADLLDAALERAEDRRVDGQQRGPRREERLRDVEHVHGQHPCDDGGQDRLEDLERVGPQDRVVQACAEGVGHGAPPPYPPMGDHAPMAYDEDLANRIRELIGAEPDVTERRMFGGLAFLVGGHMAVAASGQGGLMVRVDPGRPTRCGQAAAGPFEMRGRAMDGWLRVDAEGVRTKRQLEPWVEARRRLRALAAAEVKTLVEHAPGNVMTEPGEIARFYDRCSDLMRALLDGLAEAPDGRASSRRSRTRSGWPRRRIASVLGGVFAPAPHGVRRPPPVPLPGRAAVRLGALGDVDGRRAGASRARRPEPLTPDGLHALRRVAAAGDVVGEARRARRGRRRSARARARRGSPPGARRASCPGSR